MHFPGHNLDYLIKRTNSETRKLKIPQKTGYGKRGGQRALCTVKNNSSGYKWMSCSKGGKKHSTSIMGSRKTIFEVEEAIANRLQHRGWSGACKGKL